MKKNKQKAVWLIIVGFIVLRTLLGLSWDVLFSPSSVEATLIPTGVVLETQVSQLVFQPEQVISTDAPTFVPMETLVPTATKRAEPWPEFLICIPPEPCEEGVAHYQVWLGGEPQMGYTQQTGIGPVLESVNNTVSMPQAKGSWANAQLFSAWPYQFVAGKQTRLTIDCGDDVCLVYIVDITGKILDSFTDSSRVDEILPAGYYDNVWFVVVPNQGFELTNVSLTVKPIEDPVVILPNHIVPETGQKATEPTISGVTLNPATDQQIADRAGKAQVTIGTSRGQAISKWVDFVKTDFGFYSLYVPINREQIGMSQGDQVTAKIIAPIPVSAGYHNVTLYCDDHCNVYFLADNDYPLAPIEFDLNQQPPSEENNWTRNPDFSWTATIYLGRPTQWVIIEHVDSYGGAGISITIY